jgi:hypothetical protein
MAGPPERNPRLGHADRHRQVGFAPVNLRFTRFPPTIGTVWVEANRFPLPRYSHLGEVSGCGFDCSHCLEFLFRCRLEQRLGGVANVRSFVKCVASLCLVLTFWSAVAFAAHHHSNATESAKCAVCMVAHSAAPNATANLLQVTFAPVSTFRPEPVSAQQHLLVFALSVRPPPAV